ncbi:hypothetical protein LXM50_09815 [Microbacterium sp. Au-Mic1]|uniref:golvesin C-terminal-like domain-containing protein n=1 Tax=Microbacterium sp. Au-Mic1 TaxID=2906457 RepID=UPI001E6093B2|nr:hypothetical protein [Microbacterium sp. Au-Mic1]MCE4026265.1 hypothetical protein [Microbacterium sp. Au-Mic1]
MILVATTPHSMDAAAPVEIIIDDAAATFTGTWSTSSFQKGYYGTGYHNTDRGAISANARVATWKPTIPAAGKYTVSLWLPSGSGDRYNAVKFRLHHNGGITEFLVDQTVTGGQWRQLGRIALDFDGSGNEYLELRVEDVPAPSSGNRYVIADAVRFATPPPPITTAPDVRITRDRNYVELLWAPVEHAESYSVTRRDDTGALVEVAYASSRGYLDLAVDSSVSRDYQVTAYNGSGPGPAGGIVSASAVTGAPLQAVQGLTLTADGGKPRLSWQPQRDATTFSVYRANHSAGNFKLVARISGTDYTDTGAGGEAYYIVRAVNSLGESALSSWQANWKA